MKLVHVIFAPKRAKYMGGHKFVWVINMFNFHETNAKLE